MSNIDFSGMTMGQFDGLARRFGYIPLADVQVAVGELQGRLAAAEKQLGAGVPATTTVEGQTADVSALVAAKTGDVSSLDGKTGDLKEAAVEPKRDRGRPKPEKTKLETAAPKTGGTMPDEAAKPLDGEVLSPEAKGSGTIDDARKALTSLVAAKGMTAGRELLSEFGVAKVSLLPLTKVDAFVAKVDALLAG